MQFEALPKNSPEAKNTVEIETAKAHYRIVYETHGVRHPKEIYQGADAILSELGVSNDSRDIQRIYENLVEDKFLLEHLQSTQTPIYLTDPTAGHFTKYLLAGLASRGMIVVENALAGGLILHTILTERNKPKPISRREMIRKSVRVASKGVLAGYLATPFASHVFNADSVNSPLGELDRKLTKLNEKIHPEVVGEELTFRNLLIAENSEAVATSLTQTINRKPNLTLVIGRGHTGIEDSLRLDSQQRAERINGSIFKKYYGTLNQIMRLQFSLQDGKPVAKYDFLENPNISP